MALGPRLMPRAPRLYSAVVAQTQEVSPSFRRVRLVGPELAGFEWRGLDHWFRLFLPPDPGASLRLPRVKGRSWYRSYRQIPSAERPHCSNYTVSRFSRSQSAGELELDVVLHWHDGKLGGSVARWAVEAQAGSPVGLLDQGVMFDPPANTAAYYLAGDETGLPALRGILNDLPPDAEGVAFLEVPRAEDVTEIKAPPKVRVGWLIRGSDRAAGRVALAALEELTPLADGYAFVVGESALATGGRKALRTAGLPTSRITASGFWKADPLLHAARAS